MKYDDTDYLVNREESIEYKNNTDANIGNIEEAIKRLKKMIKKCDECKFATCEQCEINWTDVQSIKIVLLNLEVLCDMQKMADIELKNKNRINEEHKKENGLLREKVKELEDNFKELMNEYHKRVQEKIDLTQELEETIPTQIWENHEEEI